MMKYLLLLLLAVMFVLMIAPSFAYGDPNAIISNGYPVNGATIHKSGGNMYYGAHADISTANCAPGDYYFVMVSLNIYPYNFYYSSRSYNYSGDPISENSSMDYSSYAYGFTSGVPNGSYTAHDCVTWDDIPPMPNTALAHILKTAQRSWTLTD
jgi:hypothetical protein